jgi:hypothetical protein
MLAIQLEKLERRMELVGSNPFIDSKDSTRLMREAQAEMREMVRRYNDLVID